MFLWDDDAVRASSSSPLRTPFEVLLILTTAANGPETSRQARPAGRSAAEQSATGQRTVGRVP